MRGLGRVRAWAWAAVAVMGCGVAAASCSSGGGGGGSASGTSTTAHGGSRAPTSASSTTTSEAGGSSTTTTTGAAGGVPPTLGVAGAFGANGVGFGAVRPTEISLGGDPTGILSGISWQSWGGAQATGTGTSTYVAPGQSVAQGTQETATVVASGLGTCKGAPAYQQVVWYFPQNGQTPADNGGTPIQACSGP
ncbi:MAG TPA: hypothetical protein VIX84_20610 [Acidimicrobiales bacterium]